MAGGALIARIAASTLRRRGVSWTPGTTLEGQAQEAAAAAVGLLRSCAGNDALPLEEGEDFDLAVVACWYLMEGRRAEFLREYADELLYLRLRETLDDGSE